MNLSKLLKYRCNSLSDAQKRLPQCLLNALILCCCCMMLGCDFMPKDFETKVQTGDRIEKKYLRHGPYEVCSFEQESGNEEIGMFTVFYPTKKDGRNVFPAIVAVNGSGVRASQYSVLLRHFASWGFVVVANDQESAWKGDGAEASLQFLLSENKRADSPVYHRLNEQRIGIFGHSQGGVGVFNAVTTQPHARCYTACVALSPTAMPLAQALQWDYDPSMITIPSFLLAGTDGFDANTVIPLNEMQRIYQCLRGTRVMARRIKSDHGPMLYAATGYVTAWFLWHLSGNQTAAKAFVGNTPSLQHNQYYQDVELEVRSAKSPSFTKDCPFP